MHRGAARFRHQPGESNLASIRFPFRAVCTHPAPTRSPRAFLVSTRISVWGAGLIRVVETYFARGRHLTAAQLERALSSFRPLWSLAAFYRPAHWRLRQQKQGKASGVPQLYQTTTAPPCDEVAGLPARAARTLDFCHFARPWPLAM